MTDSIQKVLERESIRLMDGRHKNGFADIADLHVLIGEGYAEIYDNQGVKFVRKCKPKRPAPPLTAKRKGQNRAGYERRAYEEKRAAEFNGWGSMSTTVKYIIAEAKAGRKVIPNPNGGTK